jgi:hypothetical protein
MTRPGPGRWGVNGKSEHLRTQAEENLAAALIELTPAQVEQLDAAI